MDVGALSSVELTTLLTEYARAVDSGRTEPILGDPMAAHTVGQIQYDFSSVGATASVVSLVALRAKIFDELIADFVNRHPDAVVVDLGAGLNSMFYRVGPPQTVDWYSVDLPRVIDLRTALLPGCGNAHPIAADLAEAQWLDEIPRGRPTLIVADGLFAFLTEPRIVDIVVRATEHFGTGVLTFNDYGPVSRLNRVAGKLATRGSNSPHSQWGFAGFKDAHYPQRWAPGLTLQTEISVMHRPETVAFPPLLRLASRLSHRVPSIARKARVLQYRF